MSLGKVFNAAADYIQQYGWSKGNGWYPSAGQPACLEGGIRVACQDEGVSYIFAQQAMKDYLTSTRPEHINPFQGEVISWAWNDHPARAAEEVIEVLRAAAVIEQAKETEAAKVEVSA